MLRLGTLGVGAVALAISGVYALLISQLPPGFDRTDVGPARFPALIAILVAVLAVILLVQAWRSDPAESVETPMTRRALALLGLSLVYVAALPALPYMIATGLWMCLAILLLGGRWAAPLVAAGFVAFVYLLFHRTLGVPLP